MTTINNETSSPEGNAISIRLNGEAKEFAQGSTVADLVESLGLTGKRVAVERNLDIVPRSQHQVVQLQDNDQIEVVEAIGGG